MQLLLNFGWSIKQFSDKKDFMFSQRIGLKFSRLTKQLITMEAINFKRDLIENFIS